MPIEKEMSGLNSNQKKAVVEINGRLLILAGAGSGKTRVLTLRMAYLIRKCGVSPKAILGLTFTNKAAFEMKQRLSEFVGPQDAGLVTLSTFHSFCMQVLRQDIAHLGYTAKFSLYDEQDVQRLINQIARDILKTDGDLPSLAPTFAAIAQARNNGLAPEELEGATWHDEFARQVYQRLQAALRAYNAVDFDNLLGLAVSLFEKHPAILDKYQEQFRYIMIDEYQDTNPVQYRLASLLAAKNGNLCVVGDDDQSIYGWRGADVKNILLFDQAAVIKLEQNYRSTNTILRAANAVIKNNLQRHDKALWSERGEGEAIEIFHSPDEVKEAEAVVKRMVSLKEALKLRWSDFAILYRSNALSRQFEISLKSIAWNDGRQWIQGIPYQVVGGLEFYERREVKDLCAYLRVIVNPLDQEALLRIINQPRRGIGEESLDLLTAHNRKEQIPLWEVLKGVVHQEARFAHLILHSRARVGLETFISSLEEAKERFERGDLAANLQWLIEKIDYKRAIREEVKSQQMRDFKEENVGEFVNSMGEFERLSKEKPGDKRGLSDFVASLALDNHFSRWNKDKRNNDRAQLMTFHSAKGLEFPVCFLVGLEDHIIPHEKSVKETGLEEERRLMYVAITRAKHLLILSMAKQRSRMGKVSASRPSRFLFEIPEELLKVSDWRALSASSNDQ